MFAFHLTQRTLHAAGDDPVVEQPILGEVLEACMMTHRHLYFQVLEWIVAFVGSRSSVLVLKWAG